MKFKVSKRELLNALNLSSRAISTNTPLPSLSGIKITVGSDNLTLISSDSNISIKTIINSGDDTNTLSVFEEGDVIIDARYLLDMVRRFDDEFVEFETIDGTLIRVSSGNSEYKINGMRAFEYPDINFSSNSTPFKLKTELFSKIINETAFACSDKETRPVLTGVNLKAENYKLYINATDSYRLASKTVNLDQDLNFNITVPSKYLSEVSHALEVDEVEIVIDAQKISFYFDNTIIQTRLLDDAFPDTSRLIPTNFTKTISVDSKKLLNIVDKSSFIKSDGKSIVKLLIKGNKMEVDSLNQALSLHEECELLSYDGDDLEISCSGKYLQDAIKALNSDEVTLCFSGELKPIILKDNNNPDLIQLISPVRTYH